MVKKNFNLYEMYTEFVNVDLNDLNRLLSSQKDYIFIHSSIIYFIRLISYN